MNCSFFRLALLLVLTLVSPVAAFAVPIAALTSTLSRPQLALQVGHSDAILQMAFSPDGKTLATASADNTVKIWDISSSRVKATLPILAHKLRFSPDSRHLLTEIKEEAQSTESPTTLAVWNAATGQLEKEVHLCKDPDESTAYRLLHSGQVAVLNLDGVIEFLDIEKGETVKYLDTNALSNSQLAKSKLDKTAGFNVLDFAFSLDEKTLSVVMEDGNERRAIVTWDTNAKLARTVITGDVLRRGNGKPITDIIRYQFSSDGEILITFSNDYYLRLWDAQTGRFLSAAKTDDSTFAFLNESNMFWSGHTIFAISVNGSLKRWAHIPDDMVFEEISLINGSMLVGIEELGPAEAYMDARLLEAATNRTLKVFRNISAITPSADGRMLAVAGSDRTVRFWNFKSGRVVSSLRGLDKPLNAQALSADGKFLATASNDPKIRIWDAESGGLRFVLSGHTKPVDALLFLPHSNILVSASRDKTLRLWNANTGKAGHVLTAHSKANREVSADFGPDMSIVVSPNGKTLAVCAHHSLELDKNPSEIWVYAIPSGRLVTTVRRYFEGLKVTFSPDNKHMIVEGMMPSKSGGGGYSEAKDLWNFRTNQLIQSLNGYNDSMFLEDGKTIVDGISKWNSEFRLWDIPTKRSTSFEDTFLAVAPNGEKILACRDLTPEAETSSWEFSIIDVPTKHKQAKFKILLAIHDVVFSTDLRTLFITGIRPGRSKGSETLDAEIREASTGKILQSFESEATSPIQAETLSKKYGISLIPNEKHIDAQGALSSIYYDDFSNGEISQRLAATILPLPRVDQEVKAQAKAITFGDKELTLPVGEWLVTTPEGYFDCSANAAKYVLWNVNGELVPAERYWKKFRKPDLVRKALRGEKITAPEISNDDVPPQVRFLSVQYEASQDGSTPDAKSVPQFVSVTLEARGRHDFTSDAVQLLVNGRPLAPEYEKPVEVSDASLQEPVEIINADEKKPIILGDKGVIVIGGKAITFGDKTLGTSTPTSDKFAKHFTFRVPLPLGAANVKTQGYQDVTLRARAYDSAEIGSEESKIFLRNTKAQNVTGNLIVLCVGLSTYKNGVKVESGKKPASGKIANLVYPDDDAQAMAERLKREAKGLYDEVQIHTLLDDQVTLANLRTELQWLQESVRPGQIDTVMVFLSGHGVSDEQGEYFFPTYDFDPNPQEFKNTSLSGRELQNALGSALRARTVFLFVDSCHSGALSTLAAGGERGAANGDDLSFAVKESGVYLLASSGALQTSLESNAWNHGAFTEALMRSLKNSRVRDGIVHFDELTYLLPDEVAKLLREAKLSESAMSPVVPMEGRYLDEPVARVQP